MFKTLIMSCAVLALAVGCVKDPEKEAQKYVNDLDAGDNYYKAGIVQYFKSVGKLQRTLSGTEDVTVESIATSQKDLLEARGTLLQGKAHYERALKRASENKDIMKTGNKDGIYRNIRNIDEYVGLINKHLETLKEVKAAIEKDPSKGRATKPSATGARSA